MNRMFDKRMRDEKHSIYLTLAPAYRGAADYLRQRRRASDRSQGDRQAVWHFFQEAGSGHNHPQICTLYDIGHDDGMDFLVRKYLEGETLAQKIRRGPLSVSETVEIATQVARGLAAAHARGIVHRDLKPSNIGLTPLAWIQVCRSAARSTRSNSIE